MSKLESLMIKNIEQNLPFLRASLEFREGHTPSETAQWLYQWFKHAEFDIDSRERAAATAARMAQNER